MNPQWYKTRNRNTPGLDAARQELRYCVWTEDEETGKWDTQCGALAYPMPDNMPPSVHHYRHCMFCGKIIEEKPCWEEE